MTIEEPAALGCEQLPLEDAARWPPDADAQDSAAWTQVLRARHGSSWPAASRACLVPAKEEADSPLCFPALTQGPHPSSSPSSGKQNANNNKTSMGLGVVMQARHRSTEAAG